MPNNMDTLRSELFDQLKRLKEAQGDGVKQEIERAKAVSQVSSTIIASAKLELEFLDTISDGLMPDVINPQSTTKFFTEGDPRFNGGRKGLGTGKNLGA